MNPGLNKFIVLSRKEFISEWRNKSAISSILLYTGTTVFLIFMLFDKITVSQWITLFWIVYLFTSLNAVVRSFSQLNINEHLYYYHLIKPSFLIGVKMIYNALLMLAITLLVFVLFSLFISQPIKNLSFWFLIVFLANLGLSFSFTFIASIAAQAGSNTTLMAILAFPLILPQLLIITRLSKVAANGLQASDALSLLFSLSAIDLMIFIVSYLLFPYLWRR